jgi:hypothetical protein
MKFLHFGRVSIITNHWHLESHYGLGNHDDHSTCLGIHQNGIYITAERFLSLAFPAHSGPWHLVQLHNHLYTDGRTPWTSDQPVTRPLPKHRATQTQNKLIHIPNIHDNPCLEWDSNQRSKRPSERRQFMPRTVCYCDRHCRYHMPAI